MIKASIDGRQGHDMFVSLANNATELEYAEATQF